MSDEILVCPKCDGGGVRRLNPEHPNSTAPAPFYCTRCCQHFEEPETRAPEHPGGLTGLARELHKTDAEEVG